MRRAMTQKMTMLGAGLWCVVGGAGSAAAQAGGKVAFSSDRDGNYEIYVMNVDGTNQTRLTTNPADDLEPSFSPDGKKIAFSSFRNNNYEIYVMDADGSNPTRLTNIQAIDVEPVFSPDGSQIAFASFRDGNEEIYLMNSDGTNQTRLTTNPADDYNPSFSPDGSRIAFTSFRDGNYEIYVKNSDGPGNANNLTNSAAFDVDPSWGAPADVPGPPPPDQTPPQSWLRLWPRRLSPPDGRMVLVTATLRVQDDYDSQPAVRLEAITHNEASDASADVEGAEFGTDDRAFWLRAESTSRRRGGRVYTVVYSVTDGAGNRRFVTADVTVARGLGQHE